MLKLPITKPPPNGGEGEIKVRGRHWDGRVRSLTEQDSGKEGSAVLHSEID